MQASDEARCIISSRGADGIGHQLHAKLSCLAASSALPGVTYAKHPIFAAQYVSWHRSSIMASSAGRLSAKELDRSISQPIAMCGHKRWDQKLNRSFSRSGGHIFSDTGEGTWRHSLLPRAAGTSNTLSCKLQRQSDKRGSSMLWWLWNHTSHRCPPLPRGRGLPIFFGDNCWDLTGCSEDDLFTRWLASEGGACIRDAIVAANPRPDEFAEHINVVLHMRRGDAIVRQRALGTSPAYYVSVLAEVARMHPKAQFWLASDTYFDVIAHTTKEADGGHAFGGKSVTERTAELETAALEADRLGLRRLRRQLYTMKANLTQVDVLTDFRRMLHADVLVLGASSLSYSAGLLAFGRGKKVIAPACWPTVAELASDDELGVKAFALLPHFSTAPCVNGTGDRTSSIPGV